MNPRRRQHASVQRPDSPRQRARGAALLEGTIVLLVFLAIVFAMFDLGVAVMRENTLAEAARRLAREAIVHGDLAPPERSSWGPGRYLGNAADNTEIADAVRPALVTLEPRNVAIDVAWPDGDNRTGDRITVVLEYSHRTILPGILGSSLGLRGEATMRIEH